MESPAKRCLGVLESPSGLQYNAAVAEVSFYLTIRNRSCECGFESCRRCQFDEDNRCGPFYRAGETGIDTGPLSHTV